MLKTKLFFDVKDTEYFNRLQEYILANYGMYFEITDDKNATGATCTVSDYINRRNKRDVFLIKDEKGDISKYSCASEICSAIMLLNNTGNESISLNAASKTKFICVSSASGGAGKSTIAQSLCCNFSIEGHKVLYLNLNPFSTCEYLCEKSGRNDLTRLRYYLDKNDEGTMPGFKALVSRNAERRVDYIVNDNPSADGFIGKNEVPVLLKHLDQCGLYEKVVFDIPSYPGEGHIEIMKGAGVNLLIYINGPDEKHQKFLGLLKQSGINNIIEVANLTQNGENSIPKADNIFSAHPTVYWESIARLCRVAEGNDVQRY